MADFYQHRSVPTLHQLAERDDDVVAEELAGYAESTPLTLVMPALFSEVEGKALPGIIDELAGVGFVDEVVISMNNMAAAEIDRARDLFAGLPQKLHMIWNDGPRMRGFYAAIEAAGGVKYQSGKGTNIWAGCALALAHGRAGAIAVHDSDILSYERGMLARLCLPVLHPTLRYQFCKSYYARVSGQMNGRVMRLLFVPLIRALREVLGAQPLLEFIEGFRYPLAGEFAASPDLVSNLKMQAGWGLEVGMLGEVQGNADPIRVCQVPLGGNFLHKHRELDPQREEGRGLAMMAGEIAAVLFERLGAGEQVPAVLERYQIAAAELIRRYEHDALFNGLSYDRDAELSAVTVFREALVAAGDSASADARSDQLIQSWSETLELLPEAGELLKVAVRADSA